MTYPDDADLHRWATDGGAVAGRKKIMTNEVSQFIGALTAAYMDRCNRDGIGWDTLYAAVLVEGKISPSCSAEELFRRAYERAKVIAN